MRPILRRLLLYVLALCAMRPALGWAFDLNQLRTQLSAAPVVRGKFVQEKHLRALPQPLVSRGEFVLANGRGMLWQLRSPLQQTLRITPSGIRRQLSNGAWQANADGNSRESRLFLDLLSGDTEGLAKNFDLQLQGTPGDWNLLMTPNSVILRQIFTGIEIHGGAIVQDIELREAQGDRTVLRMTDAHISPSLSVDEQRDFAD